ncbi:hypothetical protein D8674_012416 [Pyrus ussuriensis x Pyrus communis]|uniref:Casein kinase I n=1 Tax=Pyrus ussuriensis x Pyrus communis TaxID=2448454 RepID=A0A5N5G1G6_9ROSA|nr:hypothetical protein D8674_012416 [Pyrus ussuriensis x Pyrus communis]
MDSKLFARTLIRNAMHVVAGKFKLGRKIGSGSFGELYLDGGTIDTVPAMEQEKISDELDKRVKKFLRGAEANLELLCAKTHHLYSMCFRFVQTIKAAMLGEIMDYLKLRLQVKMYVGFEGSGIPFSQDYWIGPYLHVLLSPVRAGMHKNFKRGFPLVAFFVLADAIR